MNDTLSKEEIDALLSALANPNLNMEIETRSTLEQYTGLDVNNTNIFGMTAEDKMMYQVRDKILTAKHIYEGFYYKDGKATKLSLVGVDINKGIYIFQLHSVANKIYQSIPFDLPIEKVEKELGMKVI